MVGLPKQLSDLQRIEADVRIICRACGWEHDWDREDLERYLSRMGGSTVWTEITRGMICKRRRCKSTNLYPLPVPFSRRPANAPVPLRRVDRAVIDASLAILRDAAYRSSKGPVGTPDVRLALLALRLYLPDWHLLGEFWRQATATECSVSTNYHLPLRWIEQRMERRGLLQATTD